MFESRRCPASMDMIRNHAFTLLAVLMSWQCHASCWAQDAASSERPTKVSDSIPNWDDVPGVDSFIHDGEARRRFQVTGKGLAVVVISTGINPDHASFSGRLLKGINLSGEDNNDDTIDRNGSGSHSAGIIARVAPGAKIIPIKVFSEHGGGEWRAIEACLEWVQAQREQILARHGVRISVVCMPLSDNTNMTAPEMENASAPARVRIIDLIQKLHSQGIAVCVPAGNAFQGSEGMGFPAVLPPTISVGAVNDVDVARAANNQPILQFASGLKILSLKRGRCSPFSQRLSDERGGKSRTDVFAPGISIISAGPYRADDPQATRTGRSTQTGTSPACSFAAGAILLVQERCRILTAGFGKKDWLPTVDFVAENLHAGGVEFIDEEEEDDGVSNTRQKYRRLDVVQTMELITKRHQADLSRIRQLLLIEAQKNNNSERPEVLPTPKGGKILEKTID
ncbi:MAG: S8 family serine peptidase [Planctomycetota bacterium]